MSVPYFVYQDEEDDLVIRYVDFPNEFAIIPSNTADYKKIAEDHLYDILQNYLYRGKEIPSPKKLDERELDRLPHAFSIGIEDIVVNSELNLTKIFFNRLTHSISLVTEKIKDIDPLSSETIRDSLSGDEEISSFIGIRAAQALANLLAEHGKNCMNKAVEDSKRKIEELERKVKRLERTKAGKCPDCPQNKGRHRQKNHGKAGVYQISSTKVRAIF